MTEARHWREQLALKSLEEGKVSFLKAAQMAGLSAWDFADIVCEKGIVWIRSEEFISRDIHELRPEYVKKLQDIEKKGKFLSFKNVDEMRKSSSEARFSAPFPVADQYAVTSIAHVRALVESTAIVLS